MTFTPWYELALAANIDTVVRPEGVTIDSTSVVIDPQTGTASLKPGAVEKALAKGVTIDPSVSVPMRFGLETAFHLGKGADINVYGMFSTIGGAFSGDSVKTVGAALVVRWDDIVPAVLPKVERQENESCEATERRFRACPNAPLLAHPGATWSGSAQQRARSHPGTRAKRTARQPTRCRSGTNARSDSSSCSCRSPQRLEHELSHALVQ